MDVEVAALEVADGVTVELAVVVAAAEGAAVLATGARLYNIVVASREKAKSSSMVEK